MNNTVSTGKQPVSAPPALPFLIFLAGFAVLAFTVSKPLIHSITWGGILAFFARPIFNFINTRTRGKIPGAAAGVTLIICVCFFMVPVMYFLGTLVAQAENLPAVNIANVVTSVDSFVTSTLHKLFGILGINNETADAISKDAAIMIKQGIESTAKWLLGSIQLIGTTVASIFMEALISLFVAFFFVRDWNKFSDSAKKFIPLPEDERNAFIRKGSDLLKSVVFGVVVTVAVQAILGGVGWYFAGLPNAIFFGFLMFFTGMLPLFGTALVWVPGAIYLFATGHMAAGTGLIIWGTVVVGTIDQILRPMLASGGEDGASAPVILVGILGGLSAWGFLGIFLGPVILSLFFLILDTWRQLWAKQIK